MFCFSILNISNVSALDDISITLSPSSTLLNSSWNYWPDCDYNCASQYNYLIVEFFDLNGNPVISSDSSLSGSQSLYVCDRSTSFSRFFPYIVYSLNKSCPQYEQRSGFITNRVSGNIVNSSVSAKLTLTDSLSSGDCPVCEECQVCPAIPENPYDDKFDKIITAIYVCAATVLVVYFFYCIYRMIIKSSGGFNG